MLFALLGLLAPASASASDLVLPYSTRTRAYSGYGTLVHGDNIQMGMAGATVAVPYSIGALEANPAGLAMTMGSVSAQIYSTEMTDRAVTGSDRRTITNREGGLSLAPNEWGYSIALYAPNSEEGDYQSPNTGTSDTYDVALKQLRFAVARSFLDRKLSVGAGVNLNLATRELGGQSYGGTKLSPIFGAIYHWRKHILFGASVSPGYDVGGSDPASGGAAMPGFAQPIRMPSLLTVGAGWMPNRFLTAGFSVTGAGKTSETGLLRDQGDTVGDAFTLQPRFGANYTLGEFRNFKFSAAAGTYYEATRTETIPNRLHGTFAFQVNAWFANVGLGVDEAERYHNFIFGIGIDLVRTFRLFGLIPKDTVPPYRGVFPPPLELEADGMPDGLTAGERKRFQAPSVGDVKKIVEEIPENIGSKLKGEPTIPEKQEAAEAERAKNPPKAKKEKARAAKKKPAATPLPGTSSGP